VILKDKRRLRLFNNTVLRRIFGPKKDEVTGEWRRLRNEELLLLLLLWVGLAEILPFKLQPSRPFVLQPLVFSSSVHLQRRSMPVSMNTSVSERRNYGREMAGHV
jgi:hypothetical protein